MDKILKILLVLLLINGLLGETHVKNQENGVTIENQDNEQKDQFSNKKLGCVHDQLEIPILERTEEEQREYDANRSRRKLGVTNPEPMRITVDYSNLDSMTGTKAPLGAFIKQQLEVAKKFFENTIKLDRLTTNNKYATTGPCLGDAAIPNDDKTIGIPDSDLHIYVIYEENSGASYLANAGGCYFYPGQRSPFGRVKYNLYHYDENDLSNKAFEDQLETTIHELMHVLGFSGSIMKQFINPATGNTYDTDGIDPYVSQTIRGIATNVLTTPNVVQTAKDHYGCTSLTGMQLENNGGSGSLGSHWEKAILLDENMNSQALTTRSLYTKFTFALLEDSGWYLPDYTNVDTSLWGYQKGCAFVTGSCDTTFNEFTTSSDNGCNHDYTGVGPAKYTTYTQEGGGAEICYWKQPYGNRYCVDSTYTAATGSGYPHEAFANYFGDNSRCAYSNMYKSPYSAQGYSYRCHEFVCDASNNVFVKFGGEQYACVQGGDCVVTLSGTNTEYQGTITAPDDFAYFCKVKNLCPNDCSQKGYCIDGQCHCIDGYVGVDCDTVDSGLACTSPCQTCSTVETNCDSCITGYVIGNNECKVCSDWITNCQTCTNYQTCGTCATGFFVNGSNTCTACNSPCATCQTTADTCNSCVTGFNYLLGNNQCKICSDWIPNCQTCTDYQTCSTCDSGFFLNSSNTCSPCNSPCQTCVTTADTCNSCETGFNYLLGNNQCKTCSNWISNCVTCGDYQTCTDCAVGFFINGSNTCSACTSPCDECTGSASTCDTCVSGYLIGGNQCKTCSVWISDCLTCGDYQTCTDCAAGFYINASNGCSACNSPCDECSTDADTCVNCVSGYTYNGGQCKLCSDWMSNCSACSDFQTCTSCDSGFYVDGSNSCSACNSPCASCSVDADTCDSCVTGFNYLFGSNQCKVCSDWITNCQTCSDYQTCTQCANGFFINGSNTCSPCTAPCENCSTSATTCTSCQTGGYLLGNSECKLCGSWINECTACTDYQTCTNCNTGFVVNASNTCSSSSCTGNCQTCTTVSTECTSCTPGYIKNNGYVCDTCANWVANCNTCTDYQTCSSCQSGFFIDGSGGCTPCNSPCQTCSTDADTCESCVTGFNYLLGNNECKICTDWKTNCNACSDFQTCTSCDTGYYLNNGNCLACQHPCTECNSATDCTACVAGTNRGDATVDCKCSDGFYEDSGLNCIACEYPCDICQSNGTTCTTCLDPSLRGSAPNCSCNSGYYDNGTTCRSNSECTDMDVEIDFVSLNEITLTFKGVAEWNAQKIAGLQTANYNSKLCNALLKGSFLQLLGQNPLCKLGALGTDLEIHIQLSYLTKLDASTDQVLLNQDVLLLDSCKTAKIYVINTNTNGGNYSTYTNTAVPSISLSGLSTIQTCENIVFQIESFENDGNQGLFNIQWTFSAVSNSDASHLTAVNSALASAGNNGYQVNLDSADFIAGVTYSVQITFKNFMGTSGTHNFNFSMTNLATVSITQVSQKRQFYLNQDNVIEFQFDYKECSPILDYVTNISYNYQIKIYDSGSSEVESIVGTAKKASFIFEYSPIFNSIGETMEIQIQTDNGGNIGTLTTEYQYISSGYIMRIQNGNKVISNDINSVQLEAQAFKTNIQPVASLGDSDFTSIIWSCIDAQTGNACKDKNGNTVTLSSTSLSNTVDISNFQRGNSYYFIITTNYNTVVKKQEALIQLKSSKIKQISDISNVYISEFVYERQVLLKDNVEIDVIFSSLPKKYEFIMYKLSVIYGDSVLATQQYYYPSFSFTLQNLIKDLSLLNGDDNLEVKIEITNTQDTSYYTTSFFIQLNLPPVQGTLTVNSSTGTSMNSNFVFTTADFYDNDKPLAYRFLYYPDSSDSETFYYLTSFSNINSLSTYLPYSDKKSKIQVQVKDTMENIQVQSVEVTVNKGSNVNSQINSLFNDSQDKNYIEQLTLKTIIALELKQNSDIKYKDFSSIAIEIYQTAFDSFMNYQSYEIELILGQLLEILLSDEIVCKEISLQNISDIFTTLQTMITEYQSGMTFQNVNSFSRSDVQRKQFNSLQKDYEFQSILKNLKKIISAFMSCSSNYEPYSKRRILALSDDLDLDKYVELIGILNSLSSLHTASTLPNQAYLKYTGSYYEVYSQRLTLKRVKNFFNSEAEEAFLQSQQDQVLLSYDSSINDGFIKNVDYSDNFAVTFVKIYDNIFKNDKDFPYPEQSIVITDLDIKLIDDSNNSVSASDVTISGVKSKVEFDFISGFDDDSKYVCIQKIDDKWKNDCETFVEGSSVICKCDNLLLTTVVYDEDNIFLEDGFRWVYIVFLVVLLSQGFSTIIGFVIDQKQSQSNSKKIQNVKQSGSLDNYEINQEDASGVYQKKQNQESLNEIISPTKKRQNRKMQRQSKLNINQLKEQETVEQKEDQLDIVVQEDTQYHKFQSNQNLNKEKELNDEGYLQVQNQSMLKSSNMQSMNNSLVGGQYQGDEYKKSSQEIQTKQLSIQQGFKIFHMFFQLFWVNDDDCRRYARVQYYFTRVFMALFVGSFLADGSQVASLTITCVLLLILNLYSRLLQGLSGKNKILLIVSLLINTVLLIISLVFSHLNEKDLSVSDSNKWALVCLLALLIDFIFFSTAFVVFGGILMEYTFQKSIYAKATKQKFQEYTQFDSKQGKI